MRSCALLFLAAAALLLLLAVDVASSSNSEASNDRARRHQPITPPPQPSTHAVSTSSPSGTLLDNFNAVPGSAIVLNGTNYYINFKCVYGTTQNIALQCVSDPTCLAFDYDYSSSEGCLHRITAACAGNFKGADFRSNLGSITFFQVKPTFREIPPCPKASTFSRGPSLNDESAGGTALTILLAFAGVALWVTAFVFVWGHIKRRREQEEFLMPAILH
eukprot:m.55582 g.55582  ORF g.55582 m.55582 type:complete len:218 (+) comp13321_c0_seq1:129-782(+)